RNGRPRLKAGRRQGNPQRRHHGADVRRLVKDVAVVPDRPVMDALVVEVRPEAEADDQPERDEEKEPEQQAGRDETAVPAGEGGDGTAAAPLALSNRNRRGIGGASRPKP